MISWSNPSSLAKKQKCKVAVRSCYDHQTQTQTDAPGKVPDKLLWSVVAQFRCPSVLWTSFGTPWCSIFKCEQSHDPNSLCGEHPATKQHEVDGGVSVFSIVYRSWGGWGLPTGLRSQTGGWRGRFPACGSSPPWHWCGSSHRCQLRCSTEPTRRPTPGAWRGRRIRQPLSKTGTRTHRATLHLYSFRCFQHVKQDL